MAPDTIFKDTKCTIHFALYCPICWIALCIVHYSASATFLKYHCNTCHFITVHFCPTVSATFYCSTLLHVQDALTAVHFCLWCVSVQHCLQCISTFYYASRCYTVQYNASQCNAVHQSAIQCNTMQYNASECNTVPYNAPACNVGRISGLTGPRSAFQHTPNHHHIP